MEGLQDFEIDGLLITAEIIKHEGQVQTHLDEGWPDYYDVGVIKVGDNIVEGDLEEFLYE